MIRSRRVPLNPCDCCIYGQHHAGYSPFGAGNIPYMMVDAVGHADSGAVIAALSRAMAAHPITTADLRVSMFRLRPYWLVPNASERRTLEMAKSAYRYEDLRGEPDWQRRLDELCQGRYTSTWDSRSGPQVRLEHYALPDDRTRLVVRWPHYLMDATGAQWFLSALDDAPSQGSENLAELPGPLFSDDRAVDVLSGFSLARRMKMALKGLSAQKLPPSLTIRHLIDGKGGAPHDFRFLHSHWDASAFTVIRENARSLTPEGPALHSRYLAAGVLRALHRLYTERGVATDAYCITLPMTVGASSPGGEAMPRRPLVGNYLVSPMIWCPREEAQDRGAIAETILRQLQAFLSGAGDLSQWAMLQFAAMVHPWFYGWLFKLPLGLDRFASGFSYYGEIERPLCRIGGARVVNIWGGGPTTTPPGWNPVFSRFGDRLNLSLTYSRSAMSDASAARYLSLIEAEVMEPT